MGLTGVYGAAPAEAESAPTRLGVAQIDLFCQHRVDPAVPI